MTDLEGGTTYEWAQETLKNVEPLNERDLQNNLSNIGAWFSSDMHEQYYMVLNRELSDYTVLNFLSMNYNQGVQEIKEIFDCRGPILRVDYNHENHYFEVWIRYHDDMPHMYVIFPCPDFVIEI